MTVITVVYARPRERARSSTTSRTVAGPRFQKRSITAVSSGPRRSPLAARRIRRSGLVTARSSHFARAPEASARQHPRMALRDALLAVRERGVELHDVVPVARHIRDTDRRLPALDESGERHRGKLALRVRLRQPAPYGSALRGVLP